ncbi:MAG: hypothetical protein MN733_41180 [Nitrososphaera sp.]|nr:hypothetical protein [Nitrososphaera sp.]
MKSSPDVFFPLCVMVLLIVMVTIVLMVSGCATGQALRTSVTEGGKTTVYESKTTGYWFYTKPAAIEPGKDTLELK